MDRYVVSPDLKKAFYLEGGVEVSYPFPFVNAKPDLSAEEMRDKRIGDEMKECVSESRKTLFKSIEPVVSNKRYIVKTDNSFGTWYVIFEDDGKSFSYAEYYPEIEDYEAQLILFKHCPDRSLSSRMCLFFDGDLGELHVVKGERVEKHDDASFKRAFAREVLTRLKLNAADLPGINLDAILGEPEAKK